MIKIHELIWAAILLAMAAQADASPFLVCAPVSATGPAGTVPVNYSVIVDGNTATPIISPAVTISAGTVQLHADLSTLSNGSHTVTVLATNSTGFSGPPSAPFTFSLPVVGPGPPVNLSITSN